MSSINLASICDVYHKGKSISKMIRNDIILWEKTGKYTIFSINCSDTSKEQLKIAAISDNSITELIINNVTQTIPTTDSTTFRLKQGENIIKVKGNFNVADSSITNIKFLDTWSGLTSLNGMFLGCSVLTSLDLSGLNTSNITDMSIMFTDCYVLTSLDLSNFDTSNVTNIMGMFASCESLTSLDLSNFDTSNVTNMDSAFNYCSALTSLNLGSFDTSSVTDMNRMFLDCTSLTSLNLNSFDTNNVTDCKEMLDNVLSTATIKVGSNFTKTEADCSWTGTFTRV